MSQTLASVAYGLDNVGNRTQRVDQLGNHTYAYDNLYRLTSATYPGPSTDAYTYDAVGNRLTKNASTYTYDAADRLTAVGGMSYAFDNNGNQTGRGSDTFAWDAEDRLTSATVGGTATSFAYNGDGLRDSLTLGASTTTFSWDVAAGIPQVLDDGAFKYVYGVGRIAEISATGTWYYLADGLGSVMTLVDSTGAVVNTYDYDVFGAVRASTGSQANAFTFTGEQTDASTGLEYLRARYYEVGTGRFGSKDRLNATPTWDGHVFAYASNNPTTSLDPSGLATESAEEICPTESTLAKKDRPSFFGLRYGKGRLTVTGSIICPRLERVLQIQILVYRVAPDGRLESYDSKVLECSWTNQCTRGHTWKVGAGTYYVDVNYYAPFSPTIATFDPDKFKPVTVR